MRGRRHVATAWREVPWLKARYGDMCLMAQAGRQVSKRKAARKTCTLVRKHARGIRQRRYSMFCRYAEQQETGKRQAGTNTFFGVVCSVFVAAHRHNIPRKCPGGGGRTKAAEQPNPGVFPKVEGRYFWGKRYITSGGKHERGVANVVSHTHVRTPQTRCRETLVYDHAFAPKG